MSGWTGLLSAALLVSQPGLAPEQVSAEHQPSKLDSLLAVENYVALGRTISTVSRQSDLRSDLDWLKLQMMDGRSAFLTMLYSRLLWVAATGLPDAEKSKLRQTAAMTTLYAYAAIAVDGSRCGDRSAPSRRLDQLMLWNPDIWPFIGSLPAIDREQVLEVAVALEKHTAAKRDLSGDIEFLCRAGLEEMDYNLKHGSSREVPTPPGSIGRTIELSGDGKYKPSLRDEQEWRPEAAKLRSSLHSSLSQLVAAAGGVPITAASPGK